MRRITPKADLLGSCDGTMVHTRETGWRELKAHQFCHDDHRHGRAYLESAREFIPQLRKGAVVLKAGDAGRIFWVSDAAEWIEKGVEEQLPMESFCKQLGRRLNGPGMRCNMGHVTWMANMVSLWANDEWDRHWRTVA